jgi:DNA modification methylase
MQPLPPNQVVLGDCSSILQTFPEESISCCITDPPYNYEFIGRKWDHTEITRRINRIQDSSTLVKNIPYGSIPKTWLCRDTRVAFDTLGLRLRRFNGNLRVQCVKHVG